MTFQDVFLIILRRSVRSLQLLLNDFCEKTDLDSVSTSAFCQARKKFKHTAFIELLEDHTVPQFYEYEHETYKSHRLVAIDGSIIRLPNSKEIAKEFGTVKDKNRYHTTVHPEAKASVVYDLLNKIPLHGVLARARTNDCVLAEKHLCALQKNDLVVADRAYASYKLFSRLKSLEVDFVIRAPRRRFADGAGLFKDDSVASKTIELRAHDNLAKDETLLNSIPTRFVRVILPNNEIEVLITSLVDEQRYPTESFKELYRKRWGIETYYFTLKSRLALEHFTGLSVESIKQDFHSTLYVSALESILIQDAEEVLSEKKTKYPQKVNKNISFGMIKEYAFEIIYDPSTNSEIKQKKLTDLFMQNPTLVRAGRNNPRHRRNWASGYFHRARKKHAF